MVLPPHATEKYLRRESPLLLLSVLTAASHDDLPLQQHLGQNFRQAIARLMLCEDTASLEVLQGLLVYLAWYTHATELCLKPSLTSITRCQYHPRPRRYTQYLQLAIGIIVDLRLDRPPGDVEDRIDLTKSVDTTERLGLDEQRAVVGCFYLCSTVATLLQKLCTFPCKIMYHVL